MGSEMCIRDSFNVAEELLDNKADVNTKDVNGWTALHFNAGHSFSNVTRLLLDNGADVNSTSKAGLTPLHVAAKYDSFNVAEELLSIKLM